MGLRVNQEVRAILRIGLRRLLCWVRALVRHLLIETSWILISGDIADELMLTLSGQGQTVKLAIIELEIVEIVDVYANGSNCVDMANEITWCICIPWSTHIRSVQVQAEHLLTGQLVGQELVIRWLDCI